MLRLSHFDLRDELSFLLLHLFYPLLLLLGLPLGHLCLAFKETFLGQHAARSYGLTGFLFMASLVSNLSRFDHLVGQVFHSSIHQLHSPLILHLPNLAILLPFLLEHVSQRFFPSFLRLGLDLEVSQLILLNLFLLHLL